MTSISPTPSFVGFPAGGVITGTGTTTVAPSVKVVGGIEEATGAQYSPISTLERQYEAPFGQRICLFLSTNAECSVHGGVEAIWKFQKSASKNKLGTTTTTASSGIPPVMPSNSYGLTQVTVVLPEDSSQIANDEHQYYPTTASNTFDQNGQSNNVQGRDNPFEFLNDDYQHSNAVASAPHSGNTTDDSFSDQVDQSQSSKKKGLGRMLKSMAKQTQSTLERGMQELAVRADQGRTPDLMTVFLFANQGTKRSPNQPQQLELLGTTDPLPLPPVDPATGKRNGIEFTIPLLLPPRVDDASHVILKLYIHSQASLVGVVGAKPKSKHYLVGSAYLQVGQLRQTVLQQRKAFFTLPLHSNVVQDGRLQICALPDLKMPAIGQRGWSLTDPRLSGYASGLFNPPLDQPYALPPTMDTIATPNHNEWLVATERATESTVVLPLATAYTQLCAEACQLSLQHAQGVAAHLLAKRTEQSQVGQCARVQVNVTSLLVDDPAWTSSNSSTTATMTVVWQPPDSIFEVELVAPTPLPTMAATVGQQQQGTPTAANLQFFPPACRGGFLPAIWKAYGGQLPPAGFVLGNVRFNITVPSNKNGNNARNMTDTGGDGRSYNPKIQNPFVTDAKHEDVWESIVVLENYAQAPPQQQLQPVHIPVYSLSTGHKVGSILLTLSVQLDPSSNPLPPPPPAQGGLVALVGLEPLVDGVFPFVDFDPQQPHMQTEEAKRRQQLATMGSFMSHAYLDQHLRTRRELDLKAYQQRVRTYQEALKLNFMPAENTIKLPSHEEMGPRPFRPSSSRPEDGLSAIPFNVHNASFSLEVMSPQDTNPQPMGALFHNITCGAPADHARGFGNVFSDKSFNSPIGSVSGGLRRLETKRNELAQVIKMGQNKLTVSVASFYQVARQERQYVNHVPARHSELQNLRWKVFEAVHAFHHVTWICAIRRANAFSQALGIAVSSYLTSLSDASRCQLGWPEIWARHGYLVSYEGLLSAAGKELGMIEDASIAIGMLRMVRIVLIRDDGAMTQLRVEVPHSPLLKWVQLTASATKGNGSKSEYLLEIGIHGHYFDQRVPHCLQNGTSVRLFPVLFQVGVDIRQWGANTGSQMKNQFGGEGKLDASALSSGGLLDEEDDDVGISDDDVLVALNYEALQKLNTYAHAISPIQGATAITSGISASLDSLCNWRPQEDQVLPSGAMSPSVHPSLAMLHSHIVTSAGKMNHSILDEAATMAQQLGGGGVVFCKSGKDRTAMHVTYKQAQFANRYRRQRSKNGEGIDTTLEDATRMRIYGTRLPICEKNVGQALYAFNLLQSKFMPDALKPPPNTLAGFLKGGRVFGQGGIES